jgi:UDP-2,4-diacetamido-2,4,6-trideoxy-beta-L-altropyranose hydrolase
VTGPLLILRADASATVGAGHVMRSLTLAEHWIEFGGRAECWGKVDLPFAQRRADALGVPIVARQPEEGSVLLVDIYNETERLSLALAGPAGRRVLVDDLGSDVPAGYDAVWNPNAYGRADFYRGFAGEVIAGIDCVPIRRGLPRWVPGGAGAISCGGGGATSALRAALSQLPVLLKMPQGLSVGACTPPGWRGANQNDTWSELRHATWLITAAGSTVWEAAAVGIPVAVVVFAEHQALVGEWASKAGVPVIDVRNRTDSSDIAAELAAKVKEVRPLPPLKSGAEGVARRLLRLLP